MAKILRMILLVGYGLGLVSLGMGIVIRIIPGVVPASVTPRGALVCAVALFLCSVASNFAATAVAGQEPEAAPKEVAARA